MCRSAMSHWEASSAVWKGIRSPARLTAARGARLQVPVRLAQGDYDRAHEMLDRAEPLARTIGDRRALARIASARISR